MRTASAIVVSFVISISIGVVLGKQCIQEGVCKCRFDDDSVIDLSPIGLQGGAPLIDDISPDTGGPYLYSYNPCYAFSQGNCTNVLGCQADPDEGLFYDIGDAVSTQLGYIDKDKVLLAKSSSSDGSVSRVSMVTFVCDPGVDKPKYTVSGEVTLNEYHFSITSKHACPIAPSTTPPTPTPTPRTTEKRECYKIDQCRCEFNDGSGIMDLSTVGRKDGVPLINKEYLTDNSTYSFNPCYAFSESSCTNAAGCQHRLDVMDMYYNIGVQTMVSFSYNGNSVVGTYVSEDLSRKSIVNYVCNPDMIIPAYTVEGEIEPSTYGFTIRGKDLCPRPPGTGSTTITAPPSTTRLDIKKECNAIDQCKCQFNDGSGVVDLSPIGKNDGTPLIDNEFAPDNYAYSFNPCYPFTMGTCVNAAGCQCDATNVIYYDIGDANMVNFTYDGQNVIGTYSTYNEYRTSVVTYICDPTVTIPTYTVEGEMGTAIYGFTITSKYACPSHPGSTITQLPARRRTPTWFTKLSSYRWNSKTRSGTTWGIGSTGPVYWPTYPWDRTTPSSEHNSPRWYTNRRSYPWDRTTATSTPRVYTRTWYTNRRSYPWDRTMATSTPRVYTRTWYTNRRSYPWDRTTATSTPRVYTRTWYTKRRSYPWDRTTATSTPRVYTRTWYTNRRSYPWDRTTATSTPRVYTRTWYTKRRSYPWDRTTATSTPRVYTRTWYTNRRSYPWDRTTATSTPRVYTRTWYTKRRSYPWDRTTVSGTPRVYTRTKDTNGRNYPWDRTTVSGTPRVYTRTRYTNRRNYPWDRTTVSGTPQVYTRTGYTNRRNYPWDRTTVSGTPQVYTRTRYTKRRNYPWDRTTVSGTPQVYTRTGYTNRRNYPWDRTTVSGTPQVYTRTRYTNRRNYPWDRTTVSGTPQVYTRTWYTNRRNYPWDKTTAASTPQVYTRTWYTNRHNYPWDRTTTTSTPQVYKSTVHNNGPVNPFLKPLPTIHLIFDNATREYLKLGGIYDAEVERTRTPIVPVIVGCSVVVAIVVLVGVAVYIWRSRARSDFDDREMMLEGRSGPEGDVRKY